MKSLKNKIFSRKNKKSLKLGGSPQEILREKLRANSRSKRIARDKFLKRAQQRQRRSMIHKLSKNLIKKVLYNTNLGNPTRFMQSHKIKNFNKENRIEMYTYDKFLKNLSQSNELRYEWWKEIADSHDINEFDLDSDENIILNIIPEKNHDNLEIFLKRYRKTQQNLFVEFIPHLYKFSGIPNPNDLINEFDNTIAENTSAGNNYNFDEIFQKYLKDNFDNFSEKTFSILIQRLMYLSNIYLEPSTISSGSNDDYNSQLNNVNRYIYVLKDILLKLQNSDNIDKTINDIFKNLRYILMEVDDDINKFDDQIIKWRDDFSKNYHPNNTIDDTQIKKNNKWKNIWFGSNINPYTHNNVNTFKNHYVNKGLVMYITELLKSHEWGHVYKMNNGELLKLISGSKLENLFKELIEFVVTDKNFSLFLEKFLELPTEVLSMIGL